MAWLEPLSVVRVGGPDNARVLGSAGGSSEPRRGAEIGADMARARDAGARTVVLVGGEPTLRPDLRGLLAVARGLGLAAGVVTNARALVYARVRDALLGSGATYVRLALHGPDARTHDPLVGVDGAFAQSWQGLVALLSEGAGRVGLDVACTVCAANVDRLDEIVHVLAPLGRAHELRLCFAAPLALPEDVPWGSAAQIAERAAAALEVAREAGLRSAWEGFAPCLLAGHAEHCDEALRRCALVFGPEEAGRAMAWEGAASRVRPYPCQECTNEARCPGAPAGLVEREGERVLRPTRGVRANSFNYVHVRDLEGFHLEPGRCSALGLELDGSPARHVLLARSAGVALYRSDTGDFTDAEIARVKDELEQVYADLGERATLLEFLRDVRRARSHESCRACPDRARCCGALAIDSEPPFAREERWLRKELSRMRGRVLDVGCGDQLYRDLIRELLASGHVDYHGLDPDGAALERMRADGVSGALRQGTIETFACEPGWFDYVLCLRSLNHFSDLEAAFESICRALRVQGQLVLCDSPVYAMLRTRAQAEDADSNAPVGHEHFRNWTSGQLVSFLERFPLRVLLHRPVTAQSSNEWIVKLMRVDGEPGPLRTEGTR
jgi:MoaA/NifB/PqqE/SkfB family radical SAM enzyme